MIANEIPVTTIDEYIALQSLQRRAVLEKLRFTIAKAAPQAEEVISYRMPAFKLHGILVYFAAAKNHIGFYPMPKVIDLFKKQLKDYELSKGTIRFPYDKPLPVKLLTEIVKYRVNANLEKSQLKLASRKIKSIAKKSNPK
jgi:uncharacterized protein YdhG (YjbR/CyaY superfamily)